MKLEPEVAMKTAEGIKREFEKSTAGGIKCLKALMKEKGELAEKKNQHADELEEKVKKLKEGYVMATRTQATSKHRITETEESLDKLEKRKRDMKKRLDEKEELVRETQGYTQNSSIEAVKVVEKRLEEKKAIYRENLEKFNALRQKKVDLESKNDVAQYQSRALTSKLSYLHTELHHAKLKQQRHNEEKKKIEELRAASSSKYKDLEAGEGEDKKKIEEAKLRVSIVQTKIDSREDEIVSMTINRKKLEATIRNILTKIKEQHEKHRAIDVSYTLNSDTFDV